MTLIKEKNSIHRWDVMNIHARVFSSVPHSGVWPDLNAWVALVVLKGEKRTRLSSAFLRWTLLWTEARGGFAVANGDGDGRELSLSGPQTQRSPTDSTAHKLQPGTPPEHKTHTHTKLIHSWTGLCAIPLPVIQSLIQVWPIQLVLWFTRTNVKLVTVLGPRESFELVNWWHLVLTG